MSARIRPFRPRRGATLLEAVFVLALTGSLVLLGSGSLLSLAPKYRLESAAAVVRTVLNRARYQALRDGVSYRVRFQSAGLTTERYDPNGGVWVLRGRTVVEGARVTANNAPVFTARGTVTGLATIVAANEWGSYKITLAITGRLKTVRAG